MSLVAYTKGKLLAICVDTLAQMQANEISTKTLLRNIMISTQALVLGIEKK